MSIPKDRRRAGRVIRIAALAAIAPVLMGQMQCASTTPPRVEPEGGFDLPGAAKDVSQDLARQLTPGGRTRNLVIDPILDRTTGQQTGVSSRVQAELTPALKEAMPGLTIHPFNSEGVEQAPLVLSGTVLTNDADSYSLSVAVTDRSTGLVIAQSAARFRQAGLDGSPTPMYNDSPSLVRDRSVDGYVRTSQTAAGEPADALYVEQIPTGAVLSSALDAYNEERYSDAAQLYAAAAARPDGQQLRTFNGLYLSNVQLNRMDEAEAAFGKIAALGLATNNLSVKLLFRPNSSTEFWPAAGLADVYPMWIRQLARETLRAGACLNLVGHTSSSGPEAVNIPLSVARARTVRQRMIAAEPELDRQLTATGVGASSTIVGTGTDNAADAVDRRVEFKVVPC